jgi:hypothetical protein
VRPDIATDATAKRSFFDCAFEKVVPEISTEKFFAKPKMVIFNFACAWLDCLVVIPNWCDIY